MLLAETSPKQFHGVWSLLEWRIEYEDGGVTNPFGEAPTGQLIYLPDGMMSVAMVRSGYGAANADNGNKDVYVALNTMGHANDFQYDAKWSLKNDTVIHDVTWSLNHKLTGTKQIRQVEFNGQDKLTLSTFEPMQNGQKRQHILKWKRSS